MLMSQEGRVSNLINLCKCIKEVICAVIFFKFKYLIFFFLITAMVLEKPPCTKKMEFIAIIRMLFLLVS